MQIKPEDKTQHDALFKALDWVLGKAQISIPTETTNDPEFGEYEYTGYRFVGNLPARMVTQLRALAKLGYKHPKSVDTIVNVSWVESTEEFPLIDHGVSITFGRYQSTANRVELNYNVYRYKKMQVAA